MPNLLRQFFARYKIEFAAILLLGMLVFFLQGRLLFTNHYVISGERYDLQEVFFATQDMTYQGMRNGEPATWNPYMFGGIPHLGGAQSLMLYPPNWLGAVLPTATALNWVFFFHVWIMGISMYCWTRFRGFHQAGAFVAGTVAMLCGPFYLHVMSGHTVMGSYGWTPLVFLGIDGWLRQRKSGWVLLAAGAVAMQVYAGFLQIFYYTALLSGIYSLFYLFEFKNWKSSALGLLAIYPIGLLLSAAQFLPDLGAFSEIVRSSSMDYQSVADGAVPSVNLLLLLNPWLMGGGWGVGYWGRTAGLHEILPFVGCGALLLAFSAFVRCPLKEKLKWGFLALFPLALALGSATPVFKVAFHILPMLSHFRSAFRPIFMFGMFMAFMAGWGMDNIMKGARPPRWLAIAGIGAGAVVVICGLSMLGGEDSWMADFIRSINKAPFHWYQTPITDASTMSQAIHNAAETTVRSGVWFLVFGGLLVFATKRFARYLLPALCVVEMVIFAMPVAKIFPVEKAQSPALADFLKANPGDYRVIYPFGYPHIQEKSEEIWGYDPMVLKRYAEYMFYSQGYDPDKAGADLNIHRYSSMWPLLRLKYALQPTQSGMTMQEVTSPFPRFFLATNYMVMTDRNSILQTLGNPGFDFKNTVVLEMPPGFPASLIPAVSQVEVTNSSITKWEIQVTTNVPAVLVMTDSYSRDWRANALPGSVQTSYDMQPANWAIRGIPLPSAGIHKIRIQYVPWGFHAGLAISGICWVMMIVFLAVPGLRRRMDFGRHVEVSPA